MISGSGIGAGAVIRPFYNRSGGAPPPPADLVTLLDTVVDSGSVANLTSGSLTIAATETVFLALTFDANTDVDALTVTFDGVGMLTSQPGQPYDGFNNAVFIFGLCMNGVARTGTAVADFSTSSGQPTVANMVVFKATNVVQGAGMPDDQQKRASGSSGTQDSGFTAATTNAHDLVVGAIGCANAVITDTQGTWADGMVVVARALQTGLDLKVAAKYVSVTGTQRARVTGATSRAYGAECNCYKCT